MLQKPGNESVVDGDVPADPGFQAQLRRAEEPSDRSHAYLGAAVGLRVVGRGVLVADALDAVVVDLDELDCPFDQLLQGALVVSLHNDPGVSEPLDVRRDEACRVVVFVDALTRYHMGEDVLGHAAADQHALDDLALGSGLVAPPPTVVVVGVAELLLLLHASGRDEEVVGTDLGDRRSRG